MPLVEVPRDRLKLQDRRVLSPPSLDPAWQCSKVVVVRGFVAGASLDIELNGVVVVTGWAGGFPVPNGAVVALAKKLVAGQHVRARQTFNGVTSDWCAAI